MRLSGSALHILSQSGFAELLDAYLWILVCPLLDRGVLADAHVVDPISGHAAESRTRTGAARSAARVLAEARQALGGEARIAAVKTFIAAGRTRQVRGDNLVPIEFRDPDELPDKYRAG